MKTTLLVLLFFFSALPSLLAQDVIMKRSGEKVEAKVMEVSPSEIRYKRFNSLDGPIYILPKNEVAAIQYANNTSESFELEEPVTSPAVVTIKPSLQNEAVATGPVVANNLNFYANGQADAVAFYDGYKPAGTGTLVASLLNPLIGLVPAVACSVTSPKEHNMDAPNHELLNQPDYKSGYRKQARKIKAGKVWKNWGIGLGVNLALALLIAGGQ